MSDRIRDVDDLAALTLWPSESFGRWMLQLPGVDRETLADLLASSDAASVVLVPTPSDEDDWEEFLRPLKPVLLERELAIWCPDQSLWPADRGAGRFDDWFETKFHSTVAVLGEK